MESIVLFTENQLSIGDLAKIFEGNWEVEPPSSERIVIRQNGTYIAINATDNSLSDYEQEEFEKITKQISKPYLYCIEYKNADFLRKILPVLISEDKTSLIDDDFGRLTKASDFVKKIVENPDWDWTDWSA